MRKLIPALLLFFVFSFLFRNDFSFDQDLGRHIKLGEIIINTHAVPKANLFSYTNPNFPFINTHWLFEVVAYKLNQTIGLNQLLLLKILIILIAVTLTLYTPGVSNRAPGTSILLLPIGFIFLHVLRERLDLRPEIFSFLFTAITLFILKQFLKKKHWLILLLPLIQLTWINTHIYFFVGLTLQAIFLLYLGYQYFCSYLRSAPPRSGKHPCGRKLKLLAVIFTLSVGVSLLNPNGLKGVVYPLNVQSNYGYTIVENQTMFLLESIGFNDRNFLFVKLALIIIALSLFAGYKQKTLSLLNILLLAFGTTLTLLNVRSFPYLIFICLPVLLEVLGEIKSGQLIRLAAIITTALLITESILYLNGSYYKYTDSPNETVLELPESGKGAMDFVLANNLPGLIYNNFDIGSYIIYRSYPKYSVFVDGRPEAYPKKFFQDTYIPSQYDFNKFKELDKAWGFKTIIFSHTDQTPWGRAFLNSITQDSNWSLVFIDDSWVVYVKKDIAQSLNLKNINLDSLDPNSFYYNNHFSYLKLALFLINTNHVLAGNAFLNKALTIFPDSPIANNVKGQILLSTGNIFNQSLAQGYLQKSKNIFFW